MKVFDEHNLIIKNSWEEVTIAEFFTIQDIISAKNVNDLEKKIKVLSVLAGVEDSAFDNISMPEIHLMFQNLEFLEAEPVGEIQDYYFIGGIRYKLIKQVNHITAGQFIDLSAYTKEKDLILDNLHLICATLLIPAPFLPAEPIPFKKRALNKVIRSIKNPKALAYLKKKGVTEFKSEIKNLPLEKYMQTPLEETAENIFNNMPITQAFGISVFFYLLFTSFLQVTQHYLGSTAMNQLKSISTMLETQEQKEMMKKILKKAETGLTQNGVGYPQSII